MKAVVLMYHRLGRVVLPRRRRGEDLYCLPPGRFERHLEILARSGLPVLPFAALGRRDALGAAAARAVSITFDDGHASDYTTALPALLRHGFPAAFFITAAWIGTPGHLSWPQVRELRELGMTVGAHGWDHRPLSELGPIELARQLRETRKVIAERAGAAPEFLALPAGAGNAAVVAAAFDAGFRAVTGSVARRWAPAERDVVIPRYAMRRTDGLAYFHDLVHQDLAALRHAWTRYRFTDLMRGAVTEPIDQRLQPAAERTAP
jgi:peptidoglycan/xylan/chitin deacetylase (PgdA/CDA1 family)